MTANAKNGLLLADKQWDNRYLRNSSSILVLNLMPTRKETERQFLSAFNDLTGNFELTFLYPKSHHFKGISKKIVEKTYNSLDQISENHYDGLIITGAPVETLPFSQVDYWNELLKIIDWSRSHVKEVLYECWAAQAGLFYDFEIRKYQLPKKLFGIFDATFISKDSKITQGFENGGILRMPQSRHTQIALNADELPIGLKITATSKKTGPIILESSKFHSTYVSGHPEYSQETLAKEYFRDVNKGLNIEKPENYFLNEDNTKINYSWRATSLKIYQNWANKFVSQKAELSI